MKKGFTLIELLIVVAIIAILAAIAVPNFLEAQTRSKVARTRADMRTITTALETYSIDNRQYPPDGQVNSGDFRNPDVAGQPTIRVAFGVARLNNYITTPIAYLNGTIYDPFVLQAAVRTERTYRYVNFPGTYKHYGTPNPTVLGNYQRYAGDYLLLSSGPDKIANTADPTLKPAPMFWVVTPYEASNGTLSSGDIVRTQKNGEGYTY